MTKEELIDKVGKNSFLTNDYNLAAKLNYESGIPSFDKHLDEKTLKEINAVIHISKHPKGLAIKIAKHFSSFPFGLPFTEIRRTLLTERVESSSLVFDIADDSKIIFSIKSSDIFEVKKFLDDIHLPHDFETNRPDTKWATETKSTYNSKHRKK